MRASTRRVTRRHLLRRAGAVAGLIGIGAGAYELDRALGGGSGAGPTLGTPAASSISSADGFVSTFRSRPDLRPPAMTATRHASNGGCVFLGPGSTRGVEHGPPRGGPAQGAMIVDGNGELVWFAPLTGAMWATNVRVQEYRGEQVLTWWEGKVINPGFGQGEGVILDRSYREVARVRAGNGRRADLHEFRLTARGTALITCFPELVQTDLSAVGGPYDGTAIGSIIQEVDIRTGHVLLEWHGLDHIAIAESHQPYNEPYDYLHINSIDVLPDGNLLVSARATWALYKLDRQTGEVIWRLGGKRSDFTLGRGARFAWQHDAEYTGDGRITLFDDGATGSVQTEPHSRGIVLALDQTRRSVDLARAYSHPRPLLATAMGSVQALPGGDVFVGWGTEHYATQFTAAGDVVDDISMRAPELLSYRTYRYDWRAVPDQPPALAVRARRGRHPTTLYASWNGATEAVAWRVRAGIAAHDLRTIGAVPRRGFETAIPVSGGDRWFTVAALNSAGRELASSRRVHA
jgi:hypothetical protein